MNRLFVCKTLISEIFCFMRCPMGGSRRSRSMYGRHPLLVHATIMEKNMKSSAAAYVLSYLPHYWVVCVPADT